jgi:hypothetical protein
MKGLNLFEGEKSPTSFLQDDFRVVVSLTNCKPPLHKSSCKELCGLGEF